LGTRSSDVIATRAGVDVGYVDNLIRLGILTRGEDGSFAPGAARTARVIRDLERSGLPLDGIAEAVAAGFLSFSVFDSTAYDRVAPLTDRTFREVAAQSDVPLELLSSSVKRSGSPSQIRTSRCGRTRWRSFP
jgi:hypothetical protein